MKFDKSQEYCIKVYIKSYKLHSLFFKIVFILKVDKNKTVSFITGLLKLDLKLKAKQIVLI